MDADFSTRLGESLNARRETYRLTHGEPTGPGTAPTPPLTGIDTGSNRALTNGSSPRSTTGDAPVEPVLRRAYTGRNDVIPGASRFTGSNGIDPGSGFTGTPAPDPGYPGSDNAAPSIAYSDQIPANPASSYAGINGIDPAPGYPGVNGVDSGTGYSGASSFDSAGGYSGASGGDAAGGYPRVNGSDPAAGYSSVNGVDPMLGYTRGGSFDSMPGYASPNAAESISGAAGLTGYTSPAEPAQPVPRLSPPSAALPTRTPGEFAPTSFATGESGSATFGSTPMADAFAAPDVSVPPAVEQSGTGSSADAASYLPPAESSVSSYRSLLDSVAAGLLSDDPATLSARMESALAAHRSARETGSPAIPVVSETDSATTGSAPATDSTGSTAAAAARMPAFTTSEAEPRTPDLAAMESARAATAIRHGSAADFHSAPADSADAAPAAFLGQAPESIDSIAGSAPATTHAAAAGPDTTPSLSLPAVDPATRRPAAAEPAARRAGTVPPSPRRVTTGTAATPRIATAELELSASLPPADLVPESKPRPAEAAAAAVDSSPAEAAAASDDWRPGRRRSVSTAELSEPRTAELNSISAPEAAVPAAVGEPVREPNGDEPAWRESNDEPAEQLSSVRRRTAESPRIAGESELTPDRTGESEVLSDRPSLRESSAAATPRSATAAPPRSRRAARESARAQENSAPVRTDFREPGSTSIGLPEIMRLLVASQDLEAAALQAEAGDITVSDLARAARRTRHAAVDLVTSWYGGADQMRVFGEMLLRAAGETA
ncbi:hypothetical protein [Nocardia yamanashiensis]|uniref:hypothetical protein n=1 Tax=Nocardia yamanashiensis TaxID=209247 RepID=UPI0008331270|nr:hypothetical protein [Nocardia yamanashiensis]